MSAPRAAFAELLSRAREGDQAALAELARLYEPEVRIMARVLIGPALRPYLDSMDLVQSVHRSLLVGLRLDRFDLSGPENLLGLALTMVRRKVARQWRRHRRQQRDDGAAPEAGELADVLATLASTELDPARSAQLNDTLRQVCARLDGDERRVLGLRLQGHSTAEVARLLGLDADVLRVQLSRLRQRLRGAGLTERWV
jgi:RNA polymerase sigma-70 factor (ECF subfamily)